MKRRGFLSALAALAVAPLALSVKAASAPKVRMVDKPCQWSFKDTECKYPGHPILWGDGEHDDTEALQAFVDGKTILWPDGREVGDHIGPGAFILTSPLRIKPRRVGTPLRTIVGVNFLNV